MVYLTIFKAGILEEMLDDTLEMEDDEELEEEADAEVDKVLFELTNGKLGEAGSAGVELPVCEFLSFVSPPTQACCSHWRINWRKRRRNAIWNDIDSS